MSKTAYVPIAGQRHRHGTDEDGVLEEHSHMGGGAPHRHDPETGMQMPFTHGGPAPGLPGSGYEHAGSIVLGYEEGSRHQVMAEVLRCRSCGSLLLLNDQGIHDHLHELLGEALGSRHE